LSASFGPFCLRQLRQRDCTVKSRAADEKGAASAALELSMRAETQNLVDEIKQSVLLLRRHL
jgi:hypothetical protein